jgi:adenosylcobyric acid synthase
MKKLAPIMFVGTGSDVGKSVITTGFCRIFKQDGYRPAPFKAQNMSNFSVMLDNGSEMAIAQSTQAEAAGIEPAVDMNPIMLKPTADHQSNVLLLGKSLGVKNAYEYFRGEGWLHLRDEAHHAYDRLAERYSPMVLEGAGSISELNLKDRDMVNMAMGIYAKANIILVADIERGGIFASLYGSIMLLSEEERSYIKGIIINKFRGDMKFFESGVKMIEELCNAPVLGVIPYYQDIEIVAEDSLSTLQASPQMQANDLDYKNAQYDRLADHIRQYVDMDKIYQLLQS